MSDKFLGEQYKLKETVIEDFSRDKAEKEDLKFWTNRGREFKDWQSILVKSVKINKNFIVFIIGSYGRGKTLSLLRIRDEAEKFSEKLFPVYLSFKGEEKSKPGLDFIFRIFKSIDFDKLVEDRETNEIKEAIDKVPEGFDEMKNLLKAIYSDKIKKQATLLGIASPKSEKARMALYFLRGEIKPTTSQLKELRIMRKIENIDTAKEYLAAILCFIKNLGYKSLLLAIDEFEYLFSLVSKSQHNIYLALLRGLYDFPTGLNISSDKVANMLFFIAISEDGWDKLQDIEKKEVSQGGPIKPLMRRVDLKTTLQNFDREEVEELIKKVLIYNRVTEKFEKDPLIPFTKDFVDYIYEVTEGLPSAIKVRCAQVLDAGLAERIPWLTKEYAQKILEERGF